MQKGLTIALLLFCFLGASLQAQTFSPIHPGSLHVDEFSTLDNDRVSVPSFTVGNFGAAVLDFQTLNAAKPVSVDIAGGLNFQGEEVKFFSTGDITLKSEVNDLSVNSVGSVLFQSTLGEVSTTAYYGDVSLDSRDFTILEATSGSINFDAAAFLLNGREDYSGVSFTTENKGNVVISAGQAKDWITSQVNFAGYDVTFELQSTTNFVANNGDVYIVAGDDVEVSASTISVNAGAGIDIVADVSNVLIEADGSMAISANDLELLSSNGQSYASVTGDIVISSTTTSYFQALDTVSLNGVNSGVYVTAKLNITSVAGNNVLLNSDGALTIAGIEFALTSERDKYIIDTDGDTSISAQSSIRLTTLGDFSADAQNAVNINAQGVTYSVQVDATLNSDDTVLINTVADSTFNSNNLYIDGLDGLSFYGNSLDISAARGSILLESGLDINILSSNDIKFTFEDDGYVIGNSYTFLTTNGGSSISSNSLGVLSASDIIFSGKSLFTTVSSNSISALSLTANDIHLYAGYLTLESTTTKVTGRTFLVLGEQNITISAGDTVSFAYSSAYNSHVNSYLAMANNNFNMTAFSEFYSTTDNRVTFDSSFDIDSLISLKTGSDATFSAGDAYLYGRRSFSMTSTGDAHFYARDTFSLTSSAITFNAKTLAFKSDGIFDFYTGNLTMSAVNTNFLANDAFGGDITFSAAGPLSVSSSNFQIISDATIIKSAVSTNFTTRTSSIVAGNSDVNLISGAQFTHTATDSTYMQTGNTISVGGDQGISILSHEHVSMTTQFHQDANFTSGGNLNIKATTSVSFSSKDITFDSVEKGVISFGSAYVLNAGSDVSYLSDDYIKFVATNSSEENISGPSAVSGTESANIYGGSLTFNTNNEIINSNGGGARFYSVVDTAFTSSVDGSDFIQSAYELSSFYALNGTVKMVSGDVFSITGGASRYTSGVNNTITIHAVDSVTMDSGNHGNITFYADHDYITKALDTVSVTGIPGLDSAITSTHNDSDICISSNFQGDTSFTGGKDMEVYAYGEQGFLQAYADNNLDVTSDDGSINILSEGFQTDPQYLLNDTFGILFRTTQEDSAAAGINVNSRSGSINLFSLSNTSLIARNGQNTYTAASRIDIRTTFYDADILVQTTQGNMRHTVSTKSTFISGTPSIRADTQVNATGTSSWAGVTAVNIHQLSSIEDPSDSAIIFEAYHKPMLLRGTAGVSFSADDGGLIFVEARNGDINLQSSTFTVNSLTGAVEMEGRTSAQINAGTTISLAAAGAAGSILIATPGGNDVLFNASTTDISFVSTIGEIDFVATTGINTASGNDTTFSGPCVHLYGGGSLSLESVNKISVSTAANAISFDAEVEFTVDAVTSVLIDGISGTFPLVRINAAGSTTDGLSLTAKGDIIYTTQRNLNNYNSFTSVTANSNIVFTVVANINITSHGDSATDTSVVFESHTGNVTVTAATFNSQSSTISTVTSEGLIGFNSVNTAVSGRAVVYRSNSMTVLTNSFTSRAPDQFYTSHNGAISFTATIGNINVFSDSELLVNSNGGVSVSAADDIGITAINAIDFQTPGNITLDTNTLTSTSEEGTEFDAFNSIQITSSTSATFNAQSSGVELTAVHDIAYQNIATLKVVGNSFSSIANQDVIINAAEFNITSYQLTADSGNDFVLTSVNTQIVGPNQSVSYIAHDDITLTSNTQSYTGDNNLFIVGTTGIDNYNSNGISIVLDTLTITPTPNIFSVDSRGDININSATATFFTGTANAVTRFISTGEAGVVLAATTTYTHVTKNLLTLTAFEGSINFVTNSGTFSLSAAADLVMSAHNQGSVRLTGISTAGFSAVDFFVGPPTDAGVIRGAGNVTYTASSITANAVAASFSSADDFLLTADTIGSLTASASFTLTANRRQELSSRTTFITASALATITTSGSYADLLVDTTTFSESANGGITDNSGGLMLFESGNNFLATGPTIALTSSDSMLFRADSSFISINSPAIGFSAGPLTVNARTDSIVNSYATYALTAAASDINARAQGAMYMRSFVLQGTTALYDSADDFVVNAPSITHTCATLSVQTAGEGDITVSTGSYTLSSTGSTLTVTSFGNMGALGGTYVLSDDHRSGDKGTSYYNYVQRLTNENTDGIELYAVAGAVTVLATRDIYLTSQKGNIEFRAMRDVRYDSPEDLTSVGRVGQTRITFFAVGLTNRGTNTGFLEYVPFGRSNDYCAVPAGSQLTCNVLSLMLNAIVDTMVAYNLLDPGTIAAWYF